MQYNMTTPCNECPFLKGSGFKLSSLKEHASGEFPCHKACDLSYDGGYVPRSDKTPHCAGALIFLEKQSKSHQMMRICERIGLYDRNKLDMSAPVGTVASDFRRSPSTQKEGSTGKGAERITQVGRQGYSA